MPTGALWAFLDLCYKTYVFYHRKCDACYGLCGNVGQGPLRAVISLVRSPGDFRMDSLRNSVAISGLRPPKCQNGRPEAILAITGPSHQNVQNEPPAPPKHRAFQLKWAKPWASSSKGPNPRCMTSQRPPHQSVGHFRLKARFLTTFARSPEPFA